MLVDASGRNLLVLLFESGCIREYCWLSWFVVSAILLPIAVTFYITWWFIRFFDGFFSPIYESLGIHVIGNSQSGFCYAAVLLSDLSFYYKFSLLVRLS
ncbi:hypothetical protein KC19_8G052900 [Ceratodon purpureus]|uniref:Uncharacterized protein n=1 Tax=Ceratodon purpureus TaxID=3225 RepID=A0A8T0H015_CERPU|nr:hypothetical protein KC19_8G052900 [Ceratodon purpureus]